MLTVLQLSITILTSFAGVTFAYAEGAPLPAITVLVACIAFYFVDQLKVFALTNSLAAVCGAVAFAFAGLEFFGGAIEAKLLAGGHLLLYLTWVFLLQRKSPRQYGWLCALSLLQMAVASVLTTSSWLGVALLAFTAMACWTMSVALLQRSVGVVTETAGSQPKVEVGHTWKGVARDVEQRLLNRSFVGSTLSMLFLSVVMAGLFFILTPRVWIGNYSMFGDSPITGQTLTGFTEEVKLGDIGEILENEDPVLTLRLYHQGTDREFSEKEYLDYLGTDPLFRGASLEDYSHGRWQRGDGRLIFSEQVQSPPAQIRQEYEMEPIGTQALFAFGNTIAKKGPRDSAWTGSNFTSCEFLRTSSERRQRDKYRYVVLANHGRYDDFASQRRGRLAGRPLRTYLSYLSSLTAIPDGMEPVEEIARQVVKGVNTPLEAADRIQTYLAYSGEFEYTLKLSVDDEDVDPLVDFLVNRKAGHCEYFSSAMAMMLRTLQVPCRVVSGFKGGTRSSRGFRVQQLHAHTWVEVFIDGRWHTFDPTPGARDETVSTMEGQLSFFEAFENEMEGYWNFGIRMSRGQQQEIIYQPIQEASAVAWQVGRELVQGRLSTLNRLRSRLADPRQWFTVPGAIVAGILFAILALIVYMIRSIWRTGIQTWQRRQQERQRRQGVAFYERFCDLLKRRGILQTETQTAREFIQQSILAALPELAVPRSQQIHNLVERFYQVRFGKHPLNDTQLAEIGIFLNEFEALLEQSASA